jgi:UDP-N-acetylmuramoylalanine--D-glutamate ligase
MPGRQNDREGETVRHDSYAGQTALIVGGGLSGIAAARFLLDRGARVILSDRRDAAAFGATLAALRVSPGSSGELVLELGGHNVESFRKCDLVVVSPGVPLSLSVFDESRRAGIPILAEVELASRHLRGKILGITGSNGKTTTTTLVTELLRGAGLRAYAAGNIGVPLISLVDESTPGSIYATELSSFQLEGIHQLRPHIGTILNLTPDHLDRYPGFEAYISAKRRIFMNQVETDFAVLNRDDPRTAGMAGDVPGRAFLFSRLTEPAQGAFVRAGDVCFRGEGRETRLFARHEILLRGEHNLENVLAACTIAILAGVPAGLAREVVGTFKGVEHRLEWVAEIDGVQYFNDSKATNVDAAIKSLESFPGSIHLIAGGRDKGGDFTSLRPLVERRVKHLVLIGEAAGKIREALKGAAEISDAESLAEAVACCRNRARPGDLVLLAPACASFDMFENYEHRGRAFKQIVNTFRSRN